MSTDNLLSNMWITQAEAARIRGVSRQAIHKLIKKDRLKTFKVGSVIFVDKSQVESYKILNPGRPKKRN